MKKHEREHMRSIVWRIISEKDDILRRILDLSKLKENSSWDLIFEVFGKKFTLLVIEKSEKIFE